MKTLDDHNDEAYQRLGTVPSGAYVLCPKCKTEMNYEDEGMMLLSDPPKRLVICPNCLHRGYKVEA